MKKLINILPLVLSLFLYTSFTFGNANFKFSINTGNKYFYRDQGNYFPPPVNFDTVIVATFAKDTIVAGRKYYLASGFPHFDNMWIRWDSLTGSVYKYDNSGSCSYYIKEMLLDSLMAGLGDTVRSCPQRDYVWRCYGVLDTNIFSGIRTAKKFSYSWGQGSYNISQDEKYLDSIGILYYLSITNGMLFHTYELYTLKGCIINGKVFGDTSNPIGVQSVSSEIPEDFFLYQNYPNPFNPTTRIKYDIPLSKVRDKEFSVKLSIFDILGREVTILVNEALRPSTYETVWDASSFASGTYFYKLQAGDYIETKKMVLLK